MLNSEQALKDGNLEQALADIQQLIRKDPANSKHRIYLFQLYSVLGQWEKALNQLNVLADMDASTLAMVQTYREALRCEVLRKEIFAGLKTPLIFGNPQQWIALLQQALKLTAAHQYKEARTLRNEAFELAPATAGTIDGEDFDWLADADVRMGPMLEAIVNGQYYWIPFQQIQAIRIEEPADLRDVVWMPAYFTWQNGGETVGLIPTRYPDSENQPDSALKLARKTEWQEPDEGLFIGMGQRLLSSNNNDYALMDVREIIFASTNG
ncbi:MAG: type VI secretion system protein ImpE [Methylococcaceae bacterium NSP1-2]|nr:tetratricopeptide repeat protein [Methylococcaceae bacterium]MDD1616544.1 tetratricopeptide repeat protein [Methylococcaceae bacterium]OYV17455.1 MAG: type VI secretion system protein ImpE [Methylococcaceae bacterium NSP1-2]